MNTGLLWTTLSHNVSQNHLQLNVTRTKELVVDLRRTKSPLTLVSTQGVSVDILEDYKYQWVHIDTH